MTVDNARLLADLQDAAHEREKRVGCPLCILIRDTADATTKQALTEAAAGTIGRDKLAKILRDNDTGVGGRTIDRHRREEHTP